MYRGPHTILVTGGAGFIGSNFIRYLLRNRSDISVINLDILSYAGSLENLRDVEDCHNYSFIEGDICDKSLLLELFKDNDIDAVVHFAAESHVDNSIEAPAAFIKTNIEGTFSLLETARFSWKKKAGHVFENRFHHISTDEVYGSLGEVGKFDENSCYEPNSPYSASKAASDFLVRSYHHTYKMNTVITNCSNNYGPNQHDEKLIPTIIRKAMASESIPIYGNGKNIRDWLFVEDHCEAILKVFEQGKSGETYTIGGDCEKENLTLAREICIILDEMKPREKGSYVDLITFVKDRAGHDFRYAVDGSKIKNELDWKPRTSLRSGLSKTVEHYLKKYRTKA